MIEIGTDWAVKSDEMCVTLLKKTVSKSGKSEGKIVWIAKGYYPTYTMALQAMVEKDIQGLESLDLMVHRIEELKTEIDMKLRRRNGGINAT